MLIRPYYSTCYLYPNLFNLISQHSKSIYLLIYIVSQFVIDYTILQIQGDANKATTLPGHELSKFPGSLSEKSFFIASILISLICYLQHRENIKRLLNGSEAKI